MAEGKKIYQGRDLMLFDSDGHSFAYSTSHNLNVQAETQDISSKDHSLYGATEVSKITWEITSENLATTEYDEMFSRMVAGLPILVKFGLKEDEGDNLPAEGDIDYWSLDAHKKYYQGRVIITSLQESATNGEVANYSITLQGIGELEQKLDPIEKVLDFSDSTKYTITGINHDGVTYTFGENDIVYLGGEEGNYFQTSGNRISCAMGSENYIPIIPRLAEGSKVVKITLDILAGESGKTITINGESHTTTGPRQTIVYTTDISVGDGAGVMVSAGGQWTMYIYGITLEVI